MHFSRLHVYGFYVLDFLLFVLSCFVFVLLLLLLGFFWGGGVLCFVLFFGGCFGGFFKYRICMKIEMHLSLNISLERLYIPL